MGIRVSGAYRSNEHMELKKTDDYEPGEYRDLEFLDRDKMNGILYRAGNSQGCEDNTTSLVLLIKQHSGASSLLEKSNPDWDPQILRGKMSVYIQDEYPIG